MKKILMTFSVILFIGNLMVQASELTYEEREQWKNDGISSPDRWVKKGFTSPKVIKAWIDAGAINPRDVKDLKTIANITTPEEYKKWADVEIDIAFDIRDWKNIGITDPKEAKEWKEYVGYYPDNAKEWLDAGVTSPKEASDWNSVGISPSNIDKAREINLTAQIVLEWRKVGVGYADEVIKMIKLGFSTPQEYKEYKALGVNANNIKKVKEAGLDIDAIKQWKKYGVKDINHIFVLKNGGFKNTNEYEPYKMLFMEDAVKLHKWGVKPNKLIESMSITSGLANEEIYFKDEPTFRKAYETIKNECDDISREQWFSGVDTNANKGKCFMFAARMMQRLDEKSFFGGVKQNGLAVGIKNRYFYVEDFKDSWVERNTRIGIVKGTGSFEYDSNSGKQIVSKGKIVYFK